MNIYELTEACNTELREDFRRAVYDILTEGRLDGIRARLESDPSMAGLVDDVFASDPTPNKAYLDWVLKMLKAIPEPEAKKEALQKISALIPLYHNNKNNMEASQRNIMSILSIDDMESIVHSFKAETKEIKANEQVRVEYERLFSGDPLAGLVEGVGNEYVKIYDDENWLAFSPREYDASKVFGKITDWCTAFSETSFRDRGGNDGGLIYVFNKDIDQRERNYAIETLPASVGGVIRKAITGGIRVILWNDHNEEVFKNVDYKEAINHMNVDPQVKSALASFKPNAPVPLPADVQAQIKSVLDYIGNKNHPNLQNFKDFCNSLFEKDMPRDATPENAGNRTIESKGLSYIHAGIDMGGTSHRLWNMLMENERQILNGIVENPAIAEIGFPEFNKRFQRANEVIHMRVDSENIDEYLEAKYHTYPQEQFARIKAQGERAGGDIVWYFGYIAEGHISAFGPDGWWELIYPFYHFADSMKFLYAKHKDYYNFIMDNAFNKKEE